MLSCWRYVDAGAGRARAARWLLTLTLVVSCASSGAASGGGGGGSARKATASGLEYEDLTVGQGAEAHAGATVIVHYTGWLVDGTKFDSSLDKGEPFVFRIGGGQVIRGWDEGLAGMKVGGKRRLTVPARLGYGDRARGNIPAGSTLVFEIQLLGVKGE
jgi:FKBP-type peptidyl-prolyl cis-trans isomerase FkpA